MLKYIDLFSESRPKTFKIRSRDHSVKTLYLSENVSNKMKIYQYADSYSIDYIELGYENVIHLLQTLNNLFVLLNESNIEMNEMSNGDIKNLIQLMYVLKVDQSMIDVILSNKKNISRLMEYFGIRKSDKPVEFLEKEILKQLSDINEKQSGDPRILPTEEMINFIYTNIDIGIDSAKWKRFKETTINKINDLVSESNNIRFCLKMKLFKNLIEEHMASL